VFISPFSISSALAMCYVGARNETAKQLKSLLQMESMSDADVLKLQEQLLANVKNLGSSGDVALTTANKLYPNVGFEVNKNYLQSVQKSFHSEVEQLNYSQPEAAAKRINDWVAHQTHDKIQNLVPASILNDLVRMVLVNAIYFKGNWLYKFDKNDTYKEDFNLADGSKQKVDMMKLLNKKFKLQTAMDGMNATICEFPYFGNHVAMSIILPHEGVSLDHVQKHLTVDALHGILNNPVTTGKVFAYIPKFKLEFKSEVNSAFDFVLVLIRILELFFFK
jgi:serpin B